MKHRSSEDIDLFSETSFIYEELLSFIKTISQATTLKKIEEKRVFSRYQFFLHNVETLRIEFVHYDFPALQKRKRWKGIYIDSFFDLAANKTMAILDRHEPKDAMDIYYLIHIKKFSPQKLLNLVKKKFGLTFPLTSFWDRALLASQLISNIRPLISGSEKSKIKTIDSIRLFFESEAAKEMQKHLLN